MSRALTATIFSRFTGLFTGSVNRKIFGAAVVVGGLTAAVKLVTMVKESLVAAFFGTNNQIDAFIVALLLPMTLVSIISGSLNQALIPTYVEVRQRDSEAEAHDLFSTVLAWNTVGLLAISFLLATTTNLWLPWLCWNFSPDKFRLAQSLLLWSLPIIVFSGFASTWGAIANAGERFAVVAIGPAMQPICIVAALVVGGHRWGVYSLVFGTVLGAAIEMAIVAVLLKRHGHPLLPKWGSLTAAARQVRGQYAACIMGAFILNGTILVDQGFASTLGPRSNSALNYGSKVSALMVSLGTTAMNAAILPQFSRLAAEKDWKRLKTTVNYWTKWLMLGSLTLTTAMALSSGLLVKGLYQHGAFTASDTKLVVQVQLLSLVKVPFAIALAPITRTFTSLKASQIMTVVSVGSVILNAIGDWVCMKLYGVAGIALATGIWMIFVFITLSLILHRYLLPKHESAVGGA